MGVRVLGREHEAVVQKLYILFVRTKGSRSKGPDRGGGRDYQGPGAELLHKVDVCLVLRPWPHPLSLLASATLGKLWPGCLPGFGGTS